MAPYRTAPPPSPAGPRREAPELDAEIVVALFGLPFVVTGIVQHRVADTSVVLATLAVLAVVRVVVVSRVRD